MAFVASPFIFNPFRSSASNYSWTQTGWVTENLGATISKGNETSTTFASKSSPGIVLDGAGPNNNIKLEEISGSYAQTDDGTGASGFNLSGAVLSQTEIFGSGAGAALRLSSGAANYNVLQTDDTSNVATPNSQGGFGYGTFSGSEQSGAGDGAGVVVGSVVFSEGKMATGESHTCGIEKTTNDMYCWGNGLYGELGNNSTSDSLNPVKVSGGRKWIQVTAGQNFTCAIEKDTNNAYCWGRNTSNRLGDGTLTQRNVPTQVSGTTKFSLISAGQSHACATENITNDLYCWGLNSSSQLGDATTVGKTVPTKIGTQKWSSIGLGSIHSCAIEQTTDDLYCWGSNTNSRLGDGTVTTRNIPTLVSGGLKWSKISGGVAHTCAVEKTTNNGYCWGLGTSGRLGDGTTSTRSVPTLITGGLKWKYVAAGSTHTCGVTDADDGYCWGVNTASQLGNNAVGTTQNSPYAVFGTKKWSFVAAVGIFTCAVEKNSNAVNCWGDNADGQIGNGTTVKADIPSQTHGEFVNSPSNSYLKISMGEFFTCAIENGTNDAYCWGYNAYGELGGGVTGTAYNSSMPSKVAGGRKWTDVATGINFACAIEQGTGDSYCWGRNNYGQFGTGTFNSFNVPTITSGGRKWSAITASSDTTCAIEQVTNDMYCWGLGTSGQLGDGTVVSKNLPTLVSGGRKWTKVSGGNAHMCAIEQTTNDQYCWGLNNYNQLGDTTTTTRNVPTLVAGGLKWSSVGAGYSHSCGVELGTDDGYCWGYGVSGRLGDGAATQRNAPSKITGTTKWSMVKGGYTHSCGIEKTTGNGYCWGANSAGELGDGTNTARTAGPVAVTGGKVFSQIFNIFEKSTCGLEQGSGNVYCWGLNTYGQVGDRSTDNKNVPTLTYGDYVPMASKVTDNTTQYSASGTYKAYLDAGSSSSYTWNNLSWTGSYPLGVNSSPTKISLKIKGSTSNASAPDFGSGTCNALDQTANGSVSNLSGCTSSDNRYLWFEATLVSSTDFKSTPFLDSLTAGVSVMNGYQTSGVYTSAVLDTGQKIPAGGISQPTEPFRRRQASLLKSVPQTVPL